MLGLYRPGTSLVHRLPAWTKLLALVAGAIAVALLHGPLTVAAGFLVVVALYALAGMRPRVVVAQLRPLLWVLLAIGVLNGLVSGGVSGGASGWLHAWVAVVSLATLVLLAALVTLTTRTTALVDVVVALLRPLRVLGVDPERVGLLLALGIRSVPVVAGIAAQVREAQHARGLAASPRAFAVPLVVRSLRHADALGEALAARGADD